MSNVDVKQESMSTLHGQTELMGDSEHGAAVGLADKRPSWREYLMQNVDPALATTPLASFCFMTGFMCVVI